MTGPVYKRTGGGEAHLRDEARHGDDNDAVLVGVLLIASAIVLQAADPHTLAPDESVERTMAPGEAHNYRIDMLGRELGRVRIEGRGALLAVSADGTIRERQAGEFAP